jgi:hypothetical protein
MTTELVVHDDDDDGSHACCVSHSVFISSHVVQILCTRTFQFTSSGNRSMMMGFVDIVVVVVGSSGKNNWRMSSFVISNIALLQGFNSTGGDNGRNDVVEEAVVSAAAVVVEEAPDITVELMVEVVVVVTHCAQDVSHAISTSAGLTHSFL